MDPGFGSTLGRSFLSDLKGRRRSVGSCGWSHFSVQLSLPLSLPVHCTAFRLSVSVYLAVLFKELQRVPGPLLGGSVGAFFFLGGASKTQGRHVAQLPRWARVQRPPGLPHVLYGLVCEGFFYFHCLGLRISNSPCSHWLRMHGLWSPGGITTFELIKMCSRVEGGALLPGGTF